jgi:hypothetical protein
MALRKVRVEPDFDPSVSVDADKVLLRPEVADEAEQFFEAI